ncbi:hypothetical protein PHSY_006488 [Pseudozyma hubeiensis SY62]|uniref:Uncharacterized protein n=1 Tax=Pseudozyma hubeiensis (strain SY62) TaxID=1305764 RepID=R9PBW2_PSEHS|nr:hypothetical protein PHSY_006488 [Pseudozyma hubeiensis SY62]GAC98893.1 hypothetical protein PHSY_006488 [Pseudozyma hubeiensis SY62]
MGESGVAKILKPGRGRSVENEQRAAALSPAKLELVNSGYRRQSSNRCTRKCERNFVAHPVLSFPPSSSGPSASSSSLPFSHWTTRTHALSISIELLRSS